MFFCVFVCEGARCVMIRRGNRGHEFDRKKGEVPGEFRGRRGEGRENYIIILYFQKLKENIGQNLKDTDIHRIFFK